jgi:hypothetical protein
MFALTIPNNQTQASLRCVYWGTLWAVGGVVSIRVTRKSSYPICQGNPVSFSNAKWTAAGDLMVDVWMASATIATVTLSASCGDTGPVPAGRYCGASGSELFACSGTYFLYQNNVYSSWGNASSNGILNGFNAYDSVSDTTWNVGTYNASSKSVFAASRNGYSLSAWSMGTCTMPNTAVTNASIPLSGTFCGFSSLDGTNASVTIFPNGAYYMNYWRPVNLGTTSQLCENYGVLAYSPVSWQASFSLYQQSYYSTDCYYDQYTPVIRFNSSWFDNNTQTWFLQGLAWRSSTSPAEAVYYSFTAGDACYVLQTNPNMTAMPYVARGIYTASGGGLTATALVIGKRLTLQVLRENPLFMSTTYTATTPQLAMSGYSGWFKNAVWSDNQIIWDANGNFDYVYQRNVTYWPGWLQYSGEWYGSSRSIMPTLPMQYWGLDAASNATNPTSRSNGAPEDDKNNTPVIIGVIVAVVIVIAIIAVIVMRSRSSAAPKTGSDQYTSMNSV